ncbi:hypothetical protein LX69_01366 [Breznakibacter xylanolyticus]|uniref:Uncharacterized protein n=2 Tax=Breznakibacter xylanolyticus TaxID=990 RepID=A0A2W7NDB1_9BACT|nr:hypothetical protein LX69_01366 [Breznakibacter xylanolyticus]
MMNKSKEKQYEDIVEQSIGVFSELETIVLSIKNNFIEEQRQDPRLTIEMVDKSLELLSSYLARFRGYQDRSKSEWSLEKDIDYVSQTIQSFFRKFDNPFLGSERWYQRIVQLQDQLSEQARELDSLIEE